MSLMDIIIVAGCIYMLYGYFLLMFKNEIKKGLILSSQSDPSKCKDLEGYKKYVGPRLLIFSICGIVSGCIGIARDNMANFPAAVYWVAYLLFAAAIVWFTISIRKAEKKYF